jgi:hypothetical protein
MLPASEERFPPSYSHREYGREKTFDHYDEFVPHLGEDFYPLLRMDFDQPFGFSRYQHDYGLYVGGFPYSIKETGLPYDYFPHNYRSSYVPENRMHRSEISNLPPDKLILRKEDGVNHIIETENPSKESIGQSVTSMLEIMTPSKERITKMEIEFKVESRIKFAPEEKSQLLNARLSEHDEESKENLDDNHRIPHHPKKRKVIASGSKKVMKKIKKRAPRNNWKKMTKELFTQMLEYEKLNPNVKQCDLQRVFNVNRSTYWRWKKQYNLI